jgi:hypothetical protein
MVDEAALNARFEDIYNEEGRVDSAGTVALGVAAADHAVLGAQRADAHGAVGIQLSGPLRICALSRAQLPIQTENL